MKYFRLFPSESKKYAGASTDDNFELEEKLPQTGISQANWEIIIFRCSKGILPDLIRGNEIHLISEKFKKFIEENDLLPSNIQLIENPLIDPKGKVYKYYILHVKKGMDLLSKKYSVYYENDLIKPVLDAKKVNSLELFSWSQDSLQVKIVVSERIKKLMIANGLVGIDYNATPVG